MNIEYLHGNIIEYDYYLTDGLLKFNWFAFEYDVRKYVSKCDSELTRSDRLGCDDELSFLEC